MSIPYVDLNVKRKKELIKFSYLYSYKFFTVFTKIAILSFLDSYQFTELLRLV